MTRSETLGQVLRRLTENKSPAIARALEKRKQFAHYLPARDWPGLRAGSMLQDWLNLNWLAETFEHRQAFDVARETLHLEEEKRKVWKFVDELHADLGAFETELCLALFREFLASEVE